PYRASRSHRATTPATSPLSLHDALPILLQPNSTNAKIAQLVERHLAKVEVAGSNPVFRSTYRSGGGIGRHVGLKIQWPATSVRVDRKSTRLNSSHVSISYAVFCLKKKKT